MERTVFESLIERGKSQRQIANELSISHATVRYWLNKFGIKTQNNQYNKKFQIIDGKKVCGSCDEAKSLEEFYKRTDRKNGYYSYCKKCHNEYFCERVRKVKIRMIEYKGGECERCTLSLEDSHYSVYDFHHVEPEHKDPNFDRIKYQKWEKIKEEIDKCMLVCSNCHRIIHAEMHEEVVEQPLS